MQKNKIKKSIRLYPDTYELVEAYRGQTGEDFTNALESLVIRGLDNFHSTNNIYNKTKYELNKLAKEQQEFKKTMYKILNEHTKILAEVRAITKVHAIKSNTTDTEELKNYVDKSVNKAYVAISEVHHD